jgi:ADP-ribose pyrophosphatase YjhB (NUDIX family)
VADEHHHHGHHHGPGFRFCPRCGGQLERKKIKANEPERRVCGACDFIFYEDPKIAACTVPVIDNKVVLLKRGIEPSYGKWVFPGGFMDRGERVEEAAIRETWEEANLKVEIDRLLNIYSYSGQPVVIVVYLVIVMGGELKAMDETLEVATFAPEEIPWDELAFESTKDALREYLALQEAVAKG